MRLFKKIQEIANEYDKLSLSAQNIISALSNVGIVIIFILVFFIGLFLFV